MGERESGCEDEHEKRERGCYQIGILSGWTRKPERTMRGISTGATTLGTSCGDGIQAGIPN